MKIERKVIEFDDGNKVGGVQIDKEKYDVVEITADMVGRKISIPRKPVFFTDEQIDEIKQFLDE